MAAWKVHWPHMVTASKKIVLTVLVAALLPFSVMAAPKTYLIKLRGTGTVYMATQGKKEIRRVPDAATAAKLFGKNWMKYVQSLNKTAFGRYTIGAILPSVSKPTATKPPTSRTPGQVPSPGSTTSPAAGKGTMLAGCEIFPKDNAWNQDISSLPVHPNSQTYIDSIGATGHLHPDFGEDQTYGIPYNVVSGFQPKVPITWSAYGDESDPGPYPIPDTAKVEAPSDSHVLVLDSGACKLYELYNARKNFGVGWTADSGAVWNLHTGALRHEGWTSADAAGLPILPGLVRMDEVKAGEITHAIRFTAKRTQNGWIHPATHQAGSANAALPPMGLRLRLKADYDISALTGQAHVIAVAMKKYGLILADNGSSWYFQGATDPGWKDDELNELKGVPGSAFEAVQTGEIRRE